MYFKNISAPAIALVAVISCNKSGDIANDVSVPTEINSLVKQYYRDAKWRLPNESEVKYAYLFDRPTFLKNHRDEMIRTLEIVETITLEKYTACFTRYSVGTNIYRDVIWLKLIDGSWRISTVQYFSEYSDSSEFDWKSEKAKALSVKAKEWEKDSKKWP